MIREEWKEFENTGYFVSNMGYVMTPKKIITKGRIRKDGYYDVGICGKMYLVHRLVAILFLQNYNNLPIINHKDENKGNNRVYNLEWCTYRYNIMYGKGYLVRKEKLKGSDNPNYNNKWSDEQKKRASEIKRKDLDELFSKPTTLKRFYDICKEGRANKEEYIGEYSGKKIGSNRGFYFKKKCELIEGELIKTTTGSAGYDLKSLNDIIIEPRSNCVIETGVKVKLHKDFELQVRGRSGLNFNEDLIVPTGTIDSDYSGYIKVKMYNLSDEVKIIKKGQRVAQVILNQVHNISNANIIDCERGIAGFGSSDKRLIEKTSLFEKPRRKSELKYHLNRMGLEFDDDFLKYEGVRDKKGRKMYILDKNKIQDKYGEEW